MEKFNLFMLCNIELFLVGFPLVLVFLYAFLNIYKQKFNIILFMISIIDLLSIVYFIVDYFYVATSAPLWIYVLINSYLPIISLGICGLFYFLQLKNSKNSIL